jgi:hypothetical protein
VRSLVLRLIKVGGIAERTSEARGWLAEESGYYSIIQVRRPGIQE